jgi:hypothetical protein
MAQRVALDRRAIAERPGLETPVVLEPQVRVARAAVADLAVPRQVRAAFLVSEALVEISSMRGTSARLVVLD